MKVYSSEEDTKNKYITLRRQGRARLEEKRSIFIGSAARAGSVSAAEDFIARVKREYPDATHNVWAYYINNGATARCSDDGEPQGTAGMPVLNTLKMSGATDMVVVVTRWFGGTLLGAGGLVRAYGKAAKAAIDDAGIAVFDEFTEFAISMSYSDYARCETLLKDPCLKNDGVSFDGSVTVKAAVQSSQYDGFCAKLLEYIGGRAKFAKTGSRWDYIE